MQGDSEPKPLASKCSNNFISIISLTFTCVMSIKVHTPNMVMSCAQNGHTRFFQIILIGKPIRRKVGVKGREAACFRQRMKQDAL